MTWTFSEVLGLALMTQSQEMELADEGCQRPLVGGPEVDEPVVVVTGACVVVVAPPALGVDCRVVVGTAVVDVVVGAGV
jgi:hypothetical protein